MPAPQEIMPDSPPVPSRPAQPATPSEPQRAADAAAPVPVCHVVDDEPSIRHFLSLILHGSGIDTEEFASNAEFLAAAKQRPPALVFLNVGLESAEAAQAIAALGRIQFRGFVQLMSGRGRAVLEHVRAIGEQHGLQMLPVLKKPFHTRTVAAIVERLNLGHAMAVAARIGLDEALASGWIEFWYQPRIELRHKQLAGLEAFARARHPRYGVLAPEAFMPGARETDLLDLAALSIAEALRLSASFSALGIVPRMSINVPLNVVEKLPLADLLETGSALPQWGGLTLDIPEDQAITDLALAKACAASLKQHGIGLAIDDFGRGHGHLAGLTELPFEELKIAPAFVLDCGTDKINAPLCKSVIDLAHHAGCKAAAIGIEKAADAIALVSMGCDFGQGHLLGRPMPADRLLSLLRQRAGNQLKAAKASC